MCAWPGYRGSPLCCCVVGAFVCWWRAAQCFPHGDVLLLHSCSGGTLPRYRTRGACVLQSDATFYGCVPVVVLRLLEVLPASSLTTVPGSWLPSRWLGTLGRSISQRVCSSRWVPTCQAHACRSSIVASGCVRVPKGACPRDGCSQLPAVLGYLQVPFYGMVVIGSTAIGGCSRVPVMSGLFLPAATGWSGLPQVAFASLVFF